MRWLSTLCGLLSGYDSRRTDAGLPPNHLEMAALTDPGLSRSNNEDFCLADPALRLALVADGMGGHEAGEVASHMVVEEVAAVLSQALPSGYRDIDAAVYQAIAAANKRLADENSRRCGDGVHRMGTTLVGVWWPSLDRMVVFNVGDSRVYRLRGGRLEQLSHDHSLYEEWRRAGGRGTAPRRNILSQAIGPSEQITPFVRIHDCNRGDVVILCSDGLWGVVEDERIAQLAAESVDMAAVCRKAVDGALAGGGPDNVTIVAVVAL